MENIKTPCLALRYRAPAKDWETEALPAGNGFLGAMIFGNPVTETVILNDHTLWSGGPGADPLYNGGFTGTPQENRAALKKVRELLQDKMGAFSALSENGGGELPRNYEPEDGELKSQIKILMGDKKHFGAYQMLAYLKIGDIHAAGKQNGYGGDFSEYERELNIEEALVNVCYKQNGAFYKRCYFVSYPDNVFVIRLTVRDGLISKRVWFETPQKAVRTEALGDTLTINGKPADHTDKGLKFAAQVRLLHEGGRLYTDNADGNASLIIEGADAVTLIYSSSTNYIQCADDTFNYFSDTDPVRSVSLCVNSAASLGYASLYGRHIKDYQSLYKRVSFLLEGADYCGKATDGLLKGCGGRGNKPAEDLYLEMLYYQYGRYLLISSSREGSLPANLQGIWADGLTPPWDGDYHTNINLQMNYWLAQPANLAECHTCVLNYYKSLVPRGELAAKHYYAKEDGSGVRGWVIHVENNIWGNAGPGTWYEGFYFPAGTAWGCQDIWEYYAFTLDKEFLRENFNVMLGAALFWVDNLWTDTRDGTLVANPSYSPEHGAYSLGASCDQEIIFELFKEVIKAAGILSIDSPEIEEIKKTKEKLHMPGIGINGQLMEWKDEIGIDVTGDNRHRHINHLYMLHPGSGIIPGKNARHDAMAKAAETVLERRGDGSTGWSKAWKINFWARLKDGNRAHKLLSEQLRESTNGNLFDTHPPFQIDGNFGAAAGITEMLLQSHGDTVDLLPALPDAWASGEAYGLMARGGLEIGMRWQNHTLASLVVSGKAKESVSCVLRYPKISEMFIRRQNGLNAEAISCDSVRLALKPGDVISAERDGM